LLGSFFPLPVVGPVSLLFVVSTPVRVGFHHSGWGALLTKKRRDMEANDHRRKKRGNGDEDERNQCDKLCSKSDGKKKSFGLPRW
jgi:hypothetical protein